jgi:dTDP-4-amino-4,6-dideoxy-D-galactose acyltransferase
MIERLDWDSEFFGMEVGKMDIQSDTVTNVSEFLHDANHFKLIYINSFEKLLSKRFTDIANLELMDVMITMSLNFENALYRDINYKNEDHFSENDLKDCYAIADQVSEVSRFNKEILIGKNKTKTLYREWINNGLNKTFGDGFFIERESNKIIGVHLVEIDRKNKVGYFTLTSVEKNYKNRGVGKKLWKQSFGFFAQETDINVIKSPFSLMNKDSFNFHLKLGFNKIVETKYIYHYRNSRII